MKRYYLYACTLLFIIMLSACNYPLGMTPTTVPADNVVNTTADSAVSAFGENTISLTLPQGWDIFGPLIVDNESKGSFSLYLLGENPTQNDGPGVSRVVIANAAEWTPEEFARSQCSTCPQNGYESITLAGKPGLRTQIGGGGVPFMTTWYFFEHKGNLIAFAIHDPQTMQPLEDIIESIQFE